MQKWQIISSPTLGAFEDTPNNVWNTKPYLDEFQPTVFMGIYSLRDFLKVWEHKGRKCILWCGGDIPRLTAGYWLNEDGSIKVDPEPFAEWINENCENYVENGVEHEALQVMKIESKIVPSFLGKVSDYQISYTHSHRPAVYTSVSGNDFELYGWYKIPKLAELYPDIDFHLYGNSSGAPFSQLPNVFDHGRVDKDVMNEGIRNMQGALRLTEFDGASEIIVKAMLWGQYAFSYISYPGVNHVADLFNLKNCTVPNFKGREWWLKNLNKYPWVC